MSYGSQGNKPAEYASKSSHSYIINDDEVKNFLAECDLPKEKSEIEIDNEPILKLEDLDNNPVQHIIAIDGGYTDVSIKRTFPTSTISFFQFGALFFKVKDLDELKNKLFISPSDMSRLNKLERIKLVLPTKNISYKGSNSLSFSVRESIYNFFLKPRGSSSYIESLYWFIYQCYDNKSDSYQLGNCPYCGIKVDLVRNSMNTDYTFNCSNHDCNKKIFLTDVFRLHEAVDDELGAGGILGYVTTLIEQMLLVHILKFLIEKQPSVLNNILFIKDGPLGFFGQTANMHKPMRQLINFLNTRYNLYLAGLEKSGAFVEHAAQISEKLEPGEILILNNKYIYTYILPGDPNTDEPYARTSYYSGKLIFKSQDSKIYVVTIPTSNEKVIMNPKPEDFKNLNIILHNIQKLKCDMYDNSLVPIVLANKLVSISNHPSSVLLEKFAKDNIR